MRPWPRKLPAWFWSWQLWYLGRGDYKGHRRDPKLRPKSAPKKIPAWAWFRLAFTLTGILPAWPIRKGICAYCKWFVKNAAWMSYGEVRPIPKPYTKPQRTDCSGSVEESYEASGAPNPSRSDGRYDGEGNTETLYANGKAIDRENVLPGDVGLFMGPVMERHHAIIAMDAGGETVFTFGHWPPQIIPFDQEAEAHRGQPVYWMRYKGVES